MPKIAHITFWGVAVSLTRAGILKKLKSVASDCGFPKLSDDAFHFNTDASVTLTLPPLDINGGLAFDRSRYSELTDALSMTHCSDALRLTGEGTITLTIPAQNIEDMKGYRPSWTEMAKNAAQPVTTRGGL